MLKFILKSEIDGKNVKQKLLTTLDRFIGLLRSSFSINCMTKGIHGKNSVHPDGLAADGSTGRFRADREPTKKDINVAVEKLFQIINQHDKSLFEQAILAYLAGFSGVGVYPDWNKPGLHLDIADSSHGKNRPLFWIGLNKMKLLNNINKQNGNQVYVYI